MAQNRKGAGRPKSKVHYKFIPPTHPIDISKEMDRWREIENRMSIPYDPKIQDEFQKKYIGYCQEIIDEQFATLNINQLQALLPLLNENFFVEALTVPQLQEVFACKRSVKVKNVGTFAYFFSSLSKRGLLTGDWQHQAEQGGMFVSVNGTPIKAKKLSTKLSEFHAQIIAYTDMYSEEDIPRTYKAKMCLKDKIDKLIAQL